MFIEGNCVGYAYHSLGLTPKEKTIDPWKVDWVEHFLEVEEVAHADAVAVIWNTGEREVLSHIAVLDSHNKTLIHHRPAFGTLPRTESLEEIYKEYSDARFFIKFLKLKSPPKPRKT